MPPEPQDPQEPQLPSMPQDDFVWGDITNVYMRSALMNLTQLITAQAHVVNNYFVTPANQRVGPHSNASNLSSRIWDFMRINPSSFHVTKVDEDPQGFIHNVSKR